MVPIGIGLMLGLGGGLAVGRLLQAVLVQTSPTDPATFVSIAVLLVVVAGTACFLPARQAARLDPVEVLRFE
jgi:putative ABC transport system permease protein